MAGRYRLERRLGQGGMGEVWLGRHTSLETPIALKLLDKSLLADADRETMLQRFRDEAKVTSALSKRTRHIVAVTDYGDVDGVPFLVMELLDGHSLEEAVCRGPLPAGETLTLLRQIARALAHAHEAGLVHRDLKPANIFLCKDEDGSPLVKVLDFGLVRPVRAYDRKSTGRGVVVGTPLYMSPEQARGLADIDHRADVWSLGVVAYTMLAGKEPWPGETAQDVLVAICRSEYEPISAVRPELAPFDALFERAFQRHVDERFPSAEAFVEAFALARAPTSTARLAPKVESLAETTLHGTSPPTPVVQRRGALVAIVGVSLFLRGGAMGHTSTVAPPVSAAPSPSATSVGPSLRLASASTALVPHVSAPQELPPAIPSHGPAPKPQGPKAGATNAAEPPPPTVTPAAKPAETKPPASPPKPHDKSAVF